MRQLAVLSLCLLVACGPGPVSVNKNAVSLEGCGVGSLPAAATRPNAQIAADFMDLEFQMDSGQILPILTRFEGPISARMTGAVPPFAAPAPKAAIRLS